jgi:hypothetical protein
MRQDAEVRQLEITFLLWIVAEEIFLLLNIFPSSR